MLSFLSRECRCHQTRRRIPRRRHPVPLERPAGESTSAITLGDLARELYSAGDIPRCDLHLAQRALFLGHRWSGRWRTDTWSGRLCLRLFGRRASVTDARGAARNGASRSHPPQFPGEA